MRTEGKVINLAEEKLARSPHLAGPAICVACGHEWVAVAPVGNFDELECSACGLLKGVLKYGCAPESTWICNCGCWLFVISGISKNVLCWQCGAVQNGMLD